MIANLALATLMVGLTVTIHFFGLLGLLWFLHHHGHRFHVRDSWSGLGASVLMVVLGLMIIHAIEIWLYAVAFLAHHPWLWRHRSRSPLAPVRRHRGR